MSEDLRLGPAWAAHTRCCGKPVGCTNMSEQCRMLNHPWKRWHRETYGGGASDARVSRLLEEQARMSAEQEAADARAGGAQSEGEAANERDGR